MVLKRFCDVCEKHIKGPATGGYTIKESFEDAAERDKTVGDVFTIHIRLSTTGRATDICRECTIKEAYQILVRNTINKL